MYNVDKYGKCLNIQLQDWLIHSFFLFLIWKWNSDYCIYVITLINMKNIFVYKTVIFRYSIFYNSNIRKKDMKYKTLLALVFMQLFLGI